MEELKWEFECIKRNGANVRWMSKQRVRSSHIFRSVYSHLFSDPAICLHRVNKITTLHTHIYIYIYICANNIWLSRHCLRLLFRSSESMELIRNSSLESISPRTQWWTAQLTLPTSSSTLLRQVRNQTRTITIEVNSIPLDSLRQLSNM